MAYKKITDLMGKGVTGLADTPNLSAVELQRKFDELSKEVIIPSFNALIDELLKNGEPLKSSDILKLRKSATGDVEFTLNGVDWLEITPSKADKSKVYTREEIDEKDSKINDIKANKSEIYTKNDVYTKIETERKIDEKLVETGSSDMRKSEYDTDKNGIVDNSEKLEGHPGAYFAKAADMVIALKKSNPEKIWENASPTSDFLPQHIDVDTKGHTMSIIVFKGYNDSSGLNTIICIKNTNFYMFDKRNNYRRCFISEDGSTYDFQDGTDSSGNKNSGRCVPVEIIGMF